MALGNFFVRSSPDLDAQGNLAVSPSLEMLEPRLLMSADVLGGGDEAPIQSGFNKRLGLAWEAQARYVTADAPGTHVTTPGAGAFGINTDGVVKLIVDTTMGTFLGTGALLWTGKHILTAAHVLTDDFGQAIATSIDAIFSLPGGETTVTTSNFNIHSGYDGQFFEKGNDIAIIELPSVITTPGGAPGYHIWEGGGELDRDTIKVGYGQSGEGETGTTIGAGTQRAGLNRYDGDATVFRTLGARNGREQLAYDFDSGDRGEDAFGYFHGRRELGYGDDEVGSAPGDSGGPTFAWDPNDGRYEIVGVTSYGLRVSKANGTSSDVDGLLNSSFGEFNVDTRVSSFTSYIEGQTGQVPSLNHRPVANAGADQQVTTDDLVRLDGSLSSDLNARDTLDYQWQIVTWPGDKPVLGGASGATPSFVADEAGVYDVQLTVTDPEGLSHSDVVRITAEAPPPGIHVGDIDASAFRGKRRQWGAQVSVLVVDHEGKAVSGATVTGSFGEGARGTVTGVTRANGRVSLTTPQWSRSSSITFQVEDVSGPLAYSEASNDDLERDSNGSFIRILRNGRKAPRRAAVADRAADRAAERAAALASEWRSNRDSRADDREERDERRFGARFESRGDIDALALAVARSGPLSLHTLLRDGGGVRIL